MITSSREEDFRTKQEAGSITNNGSSNITKASSSTSTPWLKLKDPRIVRVSRAFGGKDRHSKVCTTKGLRDRRVRLSVPTAIQLYDLQDRLGLNQPSKVVDWLLNATKHEIDELPPLQMPPGNFSLNHHHSMLSSTSHEVLAASSQYNKEGLKNINNIFNLEDPTIGLPKSNFWNSDALLRSKSKVVNEKENWMKKNIEEEKQEIPSNFLPRPNISQSSYQGNLLNNNPMPYGPYSYHRDNPSNFTLAHLGSQTAHDELHSFNFNVVPLPSTLSLPSGSQVLVCPPPGVTTQSYFPSSHHVTAASVEFDPSRQINHLQMLSSSTSQNPILSNSLNINAPPPSILYKPVSKTLPF